jgi:hypothetical protein
MESPPARERIGWRAIVPAVLLAFVASRLVLFGVVLALDALPIPWDRPAYAAGPLLGGLTGSDAAYYLGIASGGYHLQPVIGVYTDWVFFPGFPVLTRLVSVATLGDVALAGVIVANAALLVAMLLIARIVADKDDAKAAGLTAWLVAFAPGAVAFGMAYSDSLLLAASAGAILAVRRDRLGVAGALYALAVLVRLPGLLLGIPLFAALWIQRGRRLDAGYLVLLAGPLALLAFALYQGLVLGDPLAFIHGQAAWNIPPITQAVSGSGQGGAGGTGVEPYILVLVGLLIATLLVYTAMLPGLWRSHLPRPEVLLAFVAFGSVFLSGRLQSDARYLALGWPFAWYLATRSHRIRVLAVVLSITGYALFAVLDLSLMAP